MTIVYDPTGSLVSNKITNENHPAITEAAIYPTNQPFYKETLQIFGTDENNIVSELKYLQDYSLSPEFITYSAATGKEVFSYLVIMEPSRWINISLNYQAVGGVSDITLQQEIANAGVFDRTKPARWLDFEGESIYLHVAATDPRYYHVSFIEILADKLDQIVQRLGVPESYVTYILNDWTNKVTEVNQMMAQIQNLISEYQNMFGSGAPIASESSNGVLRLATQTEVLNGSNVIAAITPDKLLDAVNLLSNNAKILIAGEAILAGSLVAIINVNGIATVVTANGNTNVLAAVGYIKTSVVINQFVIVYFSGSNDQVTNLLPGNVYLSDINPGQATNTPPILTGSVKVQKVGIAISSTEFIFQPQFM